MSKQPRVKNGAMKAEDIKNISDAEHILLKTGMYLGSKEKNTCNELGLNLETMEIFSMTTTLSETIRKLFLEILNNATDAVFRYNIDPKKKRELNPIEVTMSRDTVSIKNESHPFPIDLKEMIKDDKTIKLYTPQLAFGVTKSSTNYDETVIRLGCGTNGFGSKLVNVFSKTFSIDIGNCEQKKRYRQTWSNNMAEVGEPKIDDYNGESYVKITYTLDFEKLNYSQYPDDAFHIYAKYCADASVGAKIPVLFNGVKIDFDIESYAKARYPHALDNYLHIQDFLVTPHGMTKKTAKIYPQFEVVVLDTPNNDQENFCEFAAMVNGNITRSGGSHVDAVFKEVSKHLFDIVGNKDRVNKINISHVKKNVCIVLICRLENPDYGGGNTKDKLTNHEKLVFHLPPKFVEYIKGWKCIEALLEMLDMKDSKSLQKTDGVKKPHVNIKRKCFDANWAGTDRSDKCILMIVEGNSAAGYAESLQKFIEGGKDIYGWYPLRGKPLNVRNASNDKLETNQEYIDLKKLIGLKERTEEFNYSIPGALDTLRYGKIWIMVDADVDGTHINGLLINLFESRFHELLKRGFIEKYATPILRVDVGKKKDLSFYSELEFRDWYKKNQKIVKNIEYYKGLGGSTDVQIKDDLLNKKIVSTEYDNGSDKALALAFDNRCANDRKKWIENREPPKEDLSLLPIMPITKFIKYQLVDHAVACIARCIPRLTDGLKVSQRKIIWTLLMKEKGYHDNPPKIKVENLASSTQRFTNYHHGQMGLNNVVTCMAQDFVGANNLPYFAKDGQFGTRAMGGKDASQPRYIHTRPMWWVKYIFKESDVEVLEIVEEEGVKIEPVTLLPIIPMVLVNGFCGIATGYSTFGPAHNPLDLCNWIKNRIKGKKNKKLMPWYRGFEGSIEFAKNKYETESIEIDEETDDIGNAPVAGLNEFAMITKGDYTIDKRGDILVKEVPIGKWYLDYTAFLKGLIENKELKDMRVYNDPKNKDRQLFELKGLKLQDKNGVFEFSLETPAKYNAGLEKLGLIKPFSIGNMMLLDNKDSVMRFKNSEEICERFYVERLPYYAKRRDNLISNLDKEIERFSLKSRFIELEITGKIKIRGTSKAECIKQMEANRLPVELLHQISIGNFTKEEVEELNTKIAKLRQTREILSAKSPEDLWIEDIDEFICEYKKEKNWIKDE